jgi:hypothetical protein
VAQAKSTRFTSNATIKKTTAFKVWQPNNNKCKCLGPLRGGEGQCAPRGGWVGNVYHGQCAARGALAQPLRPPARPPTPHGFAAGACAASATPPRRAHRPCASDRPSPRRPAPPRPAVFETFSFLPPLSNDEISKQVRRRRARPQYLIPLPGTGRGAAAVAPSRPFRASSARARLLLGLPSPS